MKWFYIAVPCEEVIDVDTDIPCEFLPGVDLTSFLAMWAADVAAEVIKCRLLRRKRPSCKKLSRQ